LGNLWQVNEDTFSANLKQIHSQETVFTIGNGYFCTRGTFEEGYPRANPATLLYGVFDTIPIAKEELANIPDWTVIKLFVNNERFRLDRGQLFAYQRTLDLSCGELRRTVDWQSSEGVQLRLVTERFASLADEHVGIIRYQLTLVSSPGDQPAQIDLRASLDSARGTNNVLHWESVDQAHEDGVLWLLSETKGTRVQLAMSTSFTLDDSRFQKTLVDSDTEPGIYYSGTLMPGETIVSEKICVMYTSRDQSDGLVHAVLEHHHELFACHSGSVSNNARLYSRLMAENQAAWEHYWDRADIVLEGDEKAQLALRYNIYQLRINARKHDTRYSVAAKGLTGFGYRGHIFHDTEIFMLPFYTYVQPDFARSLLIYRYQLLPAARRKAASFGEEGAQYPWESTLSGEETTPTSIIHPETGEVIPVLNGTLELHITASIAHAVWEYWRVTGDDEFMRDYGAEILFSTAEFWASRAEWHAERNDYEITNVIGPDEWHEHVNNNAYTNGMARHNIQSALSALDWLKGYAPAKVRELSEQLDLSETRLKRWQDVVTRLRFPQNPETGLIEQFDGFFDLPFLDMKKYQGRKESYQGILGMDGVQRYQLVKQADVLQLLTVLRDEFDPRTKKVNWDYYYPITDHDYGSSLTPALHVILACELGETEAAYTQFMKGALVDLENLRGNTPEGIHVACSGAVWQAAILGAAGLRVTDDGYQVNPVWLNGWTRLAFSFMHKGKLERVDLRRE
jgi:trehalose/maltose hydrolase-like predicted phosphorylase